MLDFKKTKNPVFDQRPFSFLRDPAIIYKDGAFRCFHTTVEEKNDRLRLYLDMSISRDMNVWETTRLTNSELNFSSPGNIIWTGDRWCMCVQSYPMSPGESWGNDESRLWLMYSSDLTEWSSPEIIRTQGCTCEWSNSPRQIDPYLVEHNEEYYCFYKSQGQLGALKSSDLKNWSEVKPDRPIISQENIPGNYAIENPCIIRKDSEYVLFFSLYRAGRGIGLARSCNLLDWQDFQIIEFPELSWADNGPTAPSIIDMRQETGCWLMFFHGEDSSHLHSAAIGIAWSKDLVNWQVA